MKTRGKRTREQTGKNTSGITPPQKRKGGTSRQHKQLNQTLLSDWLTDDETTHSQTNATPPPSTPTTSTTPPPTELSFTQPTEKLSPIMSQPRGSADRENAPPNTQISPNDTMNSPIKNALNLAASANIMSEKHNFLVSMLDSMDTKVSDIGDKLGMLESRVKTLEDNGKEYLDAAEEIFKPPTKDRMTWRKNLNSVQETLIRSQENVENLTKYIHV